MELKRKNSGLLAEPDDEVRQHGTYKVQFQINYETDFGQDVYIIGGVPELGNICKIKFNR